MFVQERIKPIYDAGESESIADLILEYITGKRKTERMSLKQDALDPLQEKIIEKIVTRLQTHEPIQYILNESWFCGFKFYVDRNVLIPRPETEELVEWVISNCKFPVDELRILDIGTGSGCIAISLKRRIRKAEVWGCDFSSEALTIARRNADAIGAAVDFVQLNILNTTEREQLPHRFDVIVSNPPYIPAKDKQTLGRNVYEFEPAAALFVPDDDPLIFYKEIASFGHTHLQENGAIYTEIHEGLGPDCLQVFRAAGYAAEIKRDLSGKERMIRAGRI